MDRDACRISGTKEIRVTNDSLSLWQVVSVLQRFGSGQRSRGVCPFLFFSSRSAPWAARKHAMNELLFLSWPCAPRPIRRRPTSCTSCSCRSCDNVWYLKASWRGVSPSLSATFRLAPSRTSSCSEIYDHCLIIGTRSWFLAIKE